MDPVVMAAVLMSIGLSVDFIAHVSYHYQLTSKKVIVDGRVVKVPVKGPQEKLEHTMASGKTLLNTMESGNLVT